MYLVRRKVSLALISKNSMLTFRGPGHLSASAQFPSPENRTQRMYLWLLLLIACVQLMHIAGFVWNCFVVNIQVLCCNVAGLESLQAFPLTELNLENCELLTAAILKSLRGLPITSLRLQEARWLTNAGLECLCSLPLTNLGLSECSGVSDAGLEPLIERRLPGLTRLYLRSSSVSEYGVAALIEAMPLLTVHGPA